jgi:maltose alpha-D-glucosyltransferase/alpha-amylase
MTNLAPITKEGWSDLVPSLETALPEYLPRQRWFGGKSRKIRKVGVTDWGELEGAAMMFLEVDYESGPSEGYLAPLIQRDGALQDALQDNALCARLLRLKELPTARGRIFAQVSDDSASSLPIRRGSAEQSNSSIIYGDRVILKLFRRQQPGRNPDIEIGKYLAEKTAFDRVPPFMGSIEYTGPSGESSAIAIVQGLVSHEGDGWTWTTGELERYYENCARAELPKDADSARDLVGGYLDAAAVLGRRTAELHLALGTETDDAAFSPEPCTAGDMATMADQIRSEATGAFDLLKSHVSRLPVAFREMATFALEKRPRITERLQFSAEGHDYGKRIRTHGDYHLGQVLRTQNDFVILDFEGEPARPLEQRRAKYSPVRDVAGMLRSFSYAANSMLMNHPERLALLEPWARVWEKTVSEGFLSAYYATGAEGNFLPGSSEDFRTLLDASLLEKAMYELSYELNNRPTWVRIPLAGILALLA